MATLLFTEPALADIARVTDFIAQDNPALAKATTGLILEAIAILRRHPRIGRAATGGFRELVISQGSTGFIARYSFDERRDRVLVLALRHQREAGFDEYDGTAGAASKRASPAVLISSRAATPGRSSRRPTTGASSI